MPNRQPKQLLVEGQDDFRVVLGLMQHHVPWPEAKDQAPVCIEAVGGVEEILNATYLNTKLKESGLQTLGIMMDADGEPIAKWDAFKSICLPHVGSLPSLLPPEGFIADCLNGLRLGLWLMPDCSSQGMLETFLGHLIPGAQAGLWQLAQDSCNQAHLAGAPFRSVHAHKANIHTWLAWQDPPGERPGLALTRKMFDAKGSTAMPFVRWFIQLFELTTAV